MNGEYNMRILICDDDLLIVEKLQKYLKSYFSHLHLSCPEIVCFSDGESLLADPGDKDILFLDIEMPGLDGIYVGNELKKKDKDIILSLIHISLSVLPLLQRLSMHPDNPVFPPAASPR